MNINFFLLNFLHYLKLDLVSHLLNLLALIRQPYLAIFEVEDRVVGAQEGVAQDEQRTPPGVAHRHHRDEAVLGGAVEVVVSGQREVRRGVALRVLD